ncbi:DMT family transporter [Methylomonas rhizoryzae]|uniref:DMT family transporter n=1 Tax=Methylomonas rhizoryzae TaxID=2608981 RepID=UPI001E2F8065|nr:DMT family transporter [Methylomonas rhizoryzae]
MATVLSSAISQHKHLCGVCLAVLAAIGFSAKAILVKFSYVDSVDAVTLLTLRMLFAAPFFLLTALRYGWRRQAEPISAADHVKLLGLGLLGFYLSSLFDFIGLQFISAGLERLILFLYPTLVLLLSAILLRKPLRRRHLIALATSYAGIILVFVRQIDMQPAGLWQGAAWVFASTLTYSLYLIGTGELVKRVGAARFTAYAMLVACVATVLQFVLTHPPQLLLEVPTRVHRLAVLMALFSTVLPGFMLSASIGLIGSGRTAMIGSVGPVATLIMAYALLDEPMGWLQSVGAGLVLAGVLSLTRKSADE